MTLCQEPVAVEWVLRDEEAREVDVQKTEAFFGLDLLAALGAL